MDFGGLLFLEFYYLFFHPQSLNLKKGNDKIELDLILFYLQMKS